MPVASCHSVFGCVRAAKPPLAHARFALLCAAEQLKHIFALIRDATVFMVDDFLGAVADVNDSKEYPKDKFNPLYVDRLPVLWSGPLSLLRVPFRVLQ